MFDVYLYLIMSTFCTKNNTRFFLSLNDQYFETPSFALTKNGLSVTEELSLFVKRYYDIDEPLFYHLLKVEKTSIINLYYSTLLPIDISLKQDNQSIYLINSNIAVVDPMVRKAMIYV